MNLSKINSVVFPGGGRYLWGALAGPANAGKRQAVLALLGIKVPKSRAAYGYTTNELAKAFGVPGGLTPAVWEGKLVDAIKAGKRIEPEARP